MIWRSRRKTFVENLQLHTRVELQPAEREDGERGGGKLLHSAAPAPLGLTTAEIHSKKRNKPDRRTDRSRRYCFFPSAEVRRFPADGQEDSSVTHGPRTAADVAEWRVERESNTGPVMDEGQS